MPSNAAPRDVEHAKVSAGHCALANTKAVAAGAYVALAGQSAACVTADRAARATSRATLSLLPIADGAKRWNASGAGGVSMYQLKNVEAIIRVPKSLTEVVRAGGLSCQLQDPADAVVGNRKAHPRTIHRALLRSRTTSPRNVECNPAAKPAWRTAGVVHYGRCVWMMSFS